MHLSLTARLVVLKELLPDPEGIFDSADWGDDADVMLKGEWVELYNNSTTPVNVANWKIADFDGNFVTITGAHTLSGLTTVPAGGYLVVYLGQALLDNTGDTLRLLNASEEILDAVGFDGLMVEPNKSIARIPDGTGAWVDPIPTPGFSNILESAVLSGEITREEALSVTTSNTTESAETTETTEATVEEAQPPITEPALRGETAPSVDPPKAEVKEEITKVTSQDEANTMDEDTTQVPADGTPAEEAETTTELPAEGDGAAGETPAEGTDNDAAM